MMKYCDIILITIGTALLTSVHANNLLNSCPAIQGIYKSPILHSMQTGLDKKGDPFVPPVPGPGETCVLWQECKGRIPFYNPMSSYPCRSDKQPPQSGDILNPDIIFFKPRPIMKEP